jgi:hypothetical protein
MSRKTNGKYVASILGLEKSDDEFCNIFGAGLPSRYVPFLADQSTLPQMYRQPAGNSSKAKGLKYTTVLEASIKAGVRYFAVAGIEGFSCCWPRIEPWLRSLDTELTFFVINNWSSV